MSLDGNQSGSDPKHAVAPPAASLNPGVQATYDEVTHGNLPLAPRVPQEMQHLTPQGTSSKAKRMWVVVGCVCLGLVIYFSLS